MWFRSLKNAFESHSARTTHRQSTRLARRNSARLIHLEPLEDRRMLSFTPAVDYPVGGNPAEILAADFNSDGKLDLATVNSGIGVLLGKPDGTFQAVKTSSANASSLAVGDFNADGKLDLAGTDGATVRILQGNGDGTFQDLSSIPAGTSPNSVAVGDFNGDGKLDLGVTSNNYYPGGSGPYGSYPGMYFGSAHVLLGHGDGTFSAPTTAFSSWGYFNEATLGDFNADGKLDFAVADQQSELAIVSLGTGTGTFGVPLYFVALPAIQSMATGDVNHDGKLDLVAVSQVNNLNNVGVLLGTGNGSFEPVQFNSVPGNAYGVALSDFDGDGNLDIVASTPSFNAVSVLRGVGDGTFRPQVSVATGTLPLGVAVGDFNGDTKADVATANQASSFSVLLNNGIWADLGAPAMTISDPLPLLEGNTGTAKAIFTVSLSSASGQPITVPYATADASATVGSGDYQAKSGTLTFAAGQTSQLITVLVNGDHVAESNETFSVTLSNPTNAFLADAVGTGTIQDDEPFLSINPVSSHEGNTGTTPMVFTVTLSAASDAPVKVGFITSDITYEWAAYASATPDVDYQATSGILTFAPGETSKPITVLINGDRIARETSEYFFLNLVSPDGARVTGSPTWGEIQDDEPYVYVGDASVVEGNSGTTPLVFNVTLSAAYDAPLTVSYTTIDGSATAGIDYTATSGTLTFAPGEITKAVTVSVKGDTVFEENDFFYLNLVESPSATIDYGTGVGTIVDDDPNTPQISISDVIKKEGNAGNTAFVFTVNLSAASSSRVTVNYATANGSAAASGDYQATSGSITFAAGQTSKTVTVQVKGDTTTESDETFAVNLSGAKNATIADAQGIGTILDDDERRIAISDVSKKEGNSGVTQFVFTVSLSSASTTAVTVDFATANGSATKSDHDYDGKSGQLTFSPGQTSKTITISVYGDTKKESDETFYVNLSNARGGKISDDRGVGTIVNDDSRKVPKNQFVLWSAIEDAMDDFLQVKRKKVAGK